MPGSDRSNQCSISLESPVPLTPCPVMARMGLLPSVKAAVVRVEVFHIRRKIPFEMPAVVAIAGESQIDLAPVIVFD